MSGVGAGGAGAGSSYTGTLTNGSTVSDVREGNGEIRITYEVGGAAPVPPTSVPTLAEWTLFILSILLALAAMLGMRRQKD